MSDEMKFIFERWKSALREKVETLESCKTDADVLSHIVETIERASNLFNLAKNQYAQKMGM